jgi:AraC-like DNA-binding protein
MIITVTSIGLMACLSQLGVEPVWLVLLNDIMLEFLFPVFFLLYFAFAFEHPLSQDRRRYWLYLPFLCTFTVNILIDLEMDFHVLDLGVERHRSTLEVYYFWEYCLSLCYTVLLSAWAWRLVRQYERDRQQQPQSNWFRQFWIISNVVILVWLVDIVTDIFIDLDLLSYLFATICVLFFWVSYRGIYQFRLAEDKFEIRQKLARQELSPTPMEEMPVPVSDNLYLQRLQTLMLEEHLYRDPDINRDKIADRLGISSGYFSQVFNGLTAKNFSEYLNEYRIADVKKMLLDPDFDQYSLVAIGYEAGFTSKSNFYAVFKKATGMTPSAYKKNHPDTLSGS